MTTCRTVTEAEAAADADAAGEEPFSQETAGQVAAILTAARPRPTA